MQHFCKDYKINIPLNNIGCGFKINVDGWSSVKPEGEYLIYTRVQCMDDK